MKYILLSLLLIILLHIVLADDNNDNIPQVTISKWQYCYGCQITNMIYSLSVIDMFNEVKKNYGKDKIVNSDELLSNLCEKNEFNKYEMGGKYSGNTNTAFLSSKKEIYDLTKQVCVDVVEACPARAFIEVDQSKRRDKCEACRVVATDLDNVRKGMNLTQNSLRAYLEEDFCSTLGLRHQPYSWLESICDEMIEDNVKTVIDIFVFQSKIETSPFRIASNLPNSMCEEFFGCEDPTAEPKDKKKKKSEL